MNKFEQIFELFPKDETGAKKLAHELHFDTIQNENGLFLLVLGGVTDNSVGFMRTQNPPQMDGAKLHNDRAYFCRMVSL